MRGDNYLETKPILDMAQSIGEALRSDQNVETQQDPGLSVELRTLLRLFHHHRGVIGLHTNCPEQSLSHFETFTKMLQDEIGADKTVGGKDQSLGVAWNELGNAYLQNHSYDRAEECLNKSIDALSSLSGSTRISINMPLVNLAFCYWLQGRLSEAGNVFQDALTDREKEYGVDDKTSFVYVSTAQINMFMAAVDIFTAPGSFSSDLAMFALHRAERKRVSYSTSDAFCNIKLQSETIITEPAMHALQFPITMSVSPSTTQLCKFEIQKTVSFSFANKITKNSRGPGYQGLWRP